MVRSPPTTAGSVAPTPAKAPGRRETAGRERPDDASRRWLTRLAPGARDRDAAVGELHALLLSAARFEVRRRAAALRELRGEALEDIAAQAADDALVAVLAKLDRYRGASRFTTWAYKFALLEAATAMRRRAWQGREVVLSDEAWALQRASGAGPPADAETVELLRAIAVAAKADLTVHQREVLLALAVDGVPIDVLAERLNTTRGALYKTLHDARRKLRRRLAADGLLPAPDPGPSDARPR
jgi:RNA polymerase sigma-70 factor (ECF subfamily)